VLDLGTLNFTTGDDLSYILYLPTYAAVAWHYNLLKNRPADLNAFLDGARQFASNEYAAALMKGSTISDAEKQAVAQKISALTGLSADYVVKANLRVNLDMYRAELLRSRGLTVGRYDARFSGASYDVLEENARYDPSYSAVLGAFTAAFNAYVREELQFGQGLTYKILPSAPGDNWDWKRATNNGSGFPGAPNVENALIQELIANPHLQLQVENGYFDLATPFFGTEYTMDHLLLPQEVRDRIHLEYYTAGHMMYLHQPDLAKLKSNIAGFIDLVSK
jgi:carboxypeptidase C (cathepsin A)